MPIPAQSRQLNRSLMRDEVCHTLLQWIMQGELRPGEKLLDTGLAANLGINCTPVREALKRLEDKELVEAAANRSTRVAKVTIKHRRLEVVYFDATTCVSDSVREHQRIIEALKSNDVGRARQRIRSNWTSRLARLRANPATDWPARRRDILFGDCVPKTIERRGL